MSASNGFHGGYDANRRLTIFRHLSYRFHPHFHPYVEDLVKRLTEKSIPGLQTSDTEYISNGDGTLAVLPDSILVALSEDLEAPFIVADSKVKLSKGIRLFLPDGTQVRLADDSSSSSTFVLPGSMIVEKPGESPGGIRFNQPSTKDVDNGDELILNADREVRIPDGRLITLPAGTKVVLLNCKAKPALFSGIFSSESYAPTNLVERPYPVKDLDFSSSGAYSVYNWELFYHIPLTVAMHLSKNQRFEEAQQWLHYIFDPTDGSDGPTPERFWKVKPFQNTDVKMIEEVLVNLSSDADHQLQQDTINSIMRWENTPFRPHVIARYRQTAYMFKTLMAYLDNLIAWGDTLFRQDTGESINEATQIYVLAANLLGPRPQAVPKKGSVAPQTYDRLRSNLDKFGNILIDLETEIPFDLGPRPTSSSPSSSTKEEDNGSRLTKFNTLSSGIDKTLYFCVPRNDKLFGYWDTVADRLFKIHNSLNIQGIFRQLPLFEPPIDPALLAKAAAAGLDVSSIVSGLNQPLPLVRFQLLVQKAAEIAQEVKSLGNSLLSAIEKEDNEALSLLRTKHEGLILEMAEMVKYSQLQEAIKARESLEKSLENTAQRYKYYERLLGKGENDLAIPELDSIDKERLRSKNFEVEEPELNPPNDIRVDIAKSSSQGIAGGKKVSSHELQELNLMQSAQNSQDQAAAMDLISSYLSLIPEFTTDVKPIGVGAGLAIGGKMFSKYFSMIASMMRADSSRKTYESNRAGKIGSYARREQDWAFQSNLAAGEITQIFKQLRAAQIREAIAEQEWRNHQQQIMHSQEIENFLKGEETSISGDNKKHKKTSTIAHYAWMKREIRGLYAQCFQFAFDIAKKAERGLQHELGDPELNFVKFGYLAGNEGLLAGEKLYLDIKRMEMAYHERNQREYELTKHVSLLQVNPVALMQLRTTGRCTVFLPEELFDMDCPGHYFRRIKSVAISIPSVTGPYASINCKLTLLKSSIRKNPLLREDRYLREGPEDDRFSDHFGSMQSIVTSNAQNDSGMFETNLRDERYMPFEGSGVISEWKLELPADIRQFDYETISDVIFHMRYTSREGGGLLQNKSIQNLNTQIAEAQAADSVQLYSIRHEFPSEWMKFKSVRIGERSTGTALLEIELRQEHFPFWSQGRVKSIKQVVLFAKDSTSSANNITSREGAPTQEEEVAGWGSKEALDKKKLWSGRLKNVPRIEEREPLSIRFRVNFIRNSIDDLWLALTWGE